MNIANLQLIDRNETATTILKLWSRSNPKSNETNIDSFKMYLHNKGYQINKDDYYRLFDQLEDFQLGRFMDKSTFIWNYSLKDISEQILNPNKMIIGKEEKPMPEKKTQEKRIGRPKGSKNKVKEFTPTKPSESVKVTNSESKLTLLDAQVFFIFTKENGENVPFNLKDADRLLTEVNKIKSQLRI